MTHSGGFGSRIIQGDTMTEDDIDPDDPAMGEMIEATLETFFNSAREQGADAATILIAAARISAGMADIIFQGMAPDVPLKNRSDVEKVEYLATYVDVIDTTLAAALDLPINLSVDDDEEVRPGMRVH